MGIKVFCLVLAAASLAACGGSYYQGPPPSHANAADTSYAVSSTQSADVYASGYAAGYDDSAANSAYVSGYSDSSAYATIVEGPDGSVTVHTNMYTPDGVVTQSASAGPYGAVSVVHPGYPQQPGYAPPPPPSNYAPAPVAMMNSYEFESLIQTINQSNFDDSKLAIIQETAGRAAFSSDQVARLVGTLTFDDNQIQAAISLYSSTVDARNWHVVYSVFKFDSSRDEVREGIAGRQPLGY